ncbi:hypothetical protein ASD52_02070 [Ensifer sp. Root142]|uniref:hypothetical protein n=1 Tax=Ensifer sp. Root142 TaxID=1736461 RepID=UPI00070E1329|nr:hypothetical protein [Ensifer sp. Root142]KQY78655.1 hypothetical protein ASD52_02070 [Ensifer sp. Root142]
MFLEKHSRFFRKYEFRFAPRHIGAPFLPLTGNTKQYSVFDAVQKHIAAEKALEVQTNGDIVELMEVKPKAGALVVLIHRASPNAAEPTYRKKARQQAGKKVTIRQAVKDADEEQSISAHLVISTDTTGNGVYRATLEEIPGISMAVIRRLIADALKEYPYEFLRAKKPIETYCTFKPEGVPSETMSNALSKGHVNFVTLVRPAKPDFVDADGLFKPEQEVLRLRVTGEINGKNWKSVFANLVQKARGDGWSDFKVDIDLDDQRNRTVKIDKDDEAKEILFVRSERASFKASLPACSIDIVDEVVEKGLAIAKS